MNGEGSASNEHDQNLSSGDYELNTNEPVIFNHALEDVETIVKSTSIPLVENLHPDECVEDCALEPILLSCCLIAEDTGASKVEDKSDCKLINGLTNDHLPHCECNQGGGFWFWSSLQD